MPEHMVILEGGPHHGRIVRGNVSLPVAITVPWAPPIPVPPPVPRRPPWWRNPAAWYRWQPPPPWTPPEPQFRQFTYRDSGETRGSYFVYRADEPWGWYSGPEINEYAQDDDLYRELVAALYAVPPAVRADSMTRWVMTLGWYKHLRRELPWEAGDGSEDESTWAPGPGEELLGKLLDIREDGGAPHIENRHYPQEAS